MRNLFVLFVVLFLSLSAQAQVNQQFFFSEEHHYSFGGGTYVFQGTKWWTNIVDCNNLHCMWGSNFFSYDTDGWLNGKEVSIYTIPLEAELIVYKDGSGAVLNYNWVNGFFHNKLILKR